MRLVKKLHCFILFIGFFHLQAQDFNTSNKEKEVVVRKLVRVILGSFKYQYNAINLKQKLEQKGFERTEILEVKNGFYRVSVGTFKDLITAEKFVIDNDLKTNDLWYQFSFPKKNLIQSTESLDENTNEINNTESDEIESKEEEEEEERKEDNSQINEEIDESIIEKNTVDENLLNQNEINPSEESNQKELKKGDDEITNEDKIQSLENHSLKSDSLENFNEDQNNNDLEIKKNQLEEKEKSGVFISIGRSITRYDFTNSLGNANPNVLSSDGLDFEIGKRGVFNFNLLFLKLLFSASLSLNQYNAIGGDGNVSYDWNTSYLGTNLYFSLETFRIFNLINFDISAGSGISHILYGEQKIGSSIFKLRENNEFDGLFVKPFVEFGSNFYNSKKVSAGLFLNLSKSFSMDNNSEQKLDFENFQIKLRLCVN